MTDGTAPSDVGFGAVDDDRTTRHCYRALVDAVDGGVFRLDADARLVAIDDALLERTGEDRDALLGEHVSRLVSTDATALERALRSGEPEGEGSTGHTDGVDGDGTAVTTVEAGIRTHDGPTGTRPIRLRPIRVDGRVRGAIGIVGPAERIAAGDGPSTESTESAPSFEAATTVLEDADVGVFVLDDGDEVAWINAATERYFGLDREAVIGRDKRALIDERIRERIADPDAFAEAVTATYDDGDVTERFECRVTAGEDRAERWLEHRSRPIESGPYAGGRIELYYDVTDQHRRAYQLRRLNEAVREWLSSSSRETVAERATEHVADILDLEINGVFLCDPDARELRPVAWSEPAAEMFDEIPTFAEGEGIAWRVFDSGDAEIYGDVTADPDVYNPDTPIRSEICLPIGDHGVVIIGSERRDAFDDGDLSLARVVASSLEATFDRLRHERRLERERAQTERLLQTAPVSISVEDADGETVLSNQRARDTLGVTGAVPIGKASVLDSWTVSDADGEPLVAGRSPAARVRATGEAVFDRELVLEGPSGERRWFSVNAAPVFDADGDLERIVSVGEEITELKAQERRLKRRKRDLETELSEILGRVSDGFYALDDEFRFTHVNETAEELLGRSREDLLGEVVWEVFPDAVDSDLEKGYREAFETQEPLSFERYSEPLGIWAQVQVYPSETGLSIYFRDITERRERQRRLEESEQRYRTLAENFPNGIVALYDEELRYTAAGGQLVDELGIDQDGAIGQRIQDRYPDDLLAEIEPHFRAALEGEERSFEVSYYGRDLLAHTLPVRTGGDVRAGMLVVQDVTERKEYERKLEESNERLEQFAYAASHDLQEPLRMVTSYLQLIESRYADALDEDGREFIEFAVDGADRMREMIDGLLEYSRVETRGDPFEPVDLEETLAAVERDLELQIAESDAEIDVGSLPRVRGDASQLRQVFQNLLSNAIEYSGDEPPRIEIDAEREDGTWRVAVSDEGIGIALGDQERVFEIFQRLHGREDHDGTGIGLALCRRIVERHGGEITVDSEPGAGSTFTVTLPAADG